MDHILFSDIQDYFEYILKKQQKTDNSSIKIYLNKIKNKITFKIKIGYCLVQLKTSSKRVIQKTAEATDALIGNKIADKVSKVSKTLPQNNSETITNEHDKELLKERYISPEEREEIVHEVRLIY